MYLQNGTGDWRDGCNDPKLYLILGIQNNCDYFQVEATTDIS